MYLEATQIHQLLGAVVGAVVVFFAANAWPLKISIGILLLLIPFQPIDTRFGSANVIMTYVLFGALLLQGRLRYLPMLWPILAVIFAYLLTISQLPRAIYVDHGLQLFFLISGFLVFVLAYNLAREGHDPKFFINLLAVVNLFVVLYCVVQLSIGPGERFYFFGNENLWMHRNRGAGDPRLVGPFGTPGLTAAYFMSMTVMLVYEILHSTRSRRRMLLILVAVNVGMMIATANRGSFLVLIASMLAVLYLFRRKLGVARIAQLVVASAVVLVVTGAAIVNYTNFNVMFDRLERTTEMTGGIPDTRQGVWPAAWMAFKEKPILGHGPYLGQEVALRHRVPHPDQLFLRYPHNLYLHLLVTVGVVGAISMAIFLLGVLRRVVRGVAATSFDSDYERGWVLIGAVVICGFLADQLKIEFLRPGTVDYAHFVFALFGIFLGWADAALKRPRRLPQDSTLPQQSTNVGGERPSIAGVSRMAK